MGSLSALPTTGFHHNVCGRLYVSWSRLFSELQKPLKCLWMGISCSHVHYHGDWEWSGGWGSFADFFPAVAFTNLMEDCKSCLISRLKTWAHTVLIQWYRLVYPQPEDSLAAPGNPEQWQRLIELLGGVLTAFNLKEPVQIWYQEEEHCSEMSWFCWALTKHPLSWRQVQSWVGPEGNDAQW